jgi:hypothetical protein
MIVKQNTQADEYRMFVDTIFSKGTDSVSKLSYSGSGDGQIDLDDGDYYKEKLNQKNTNLSIFNTHIINLINTIPYFKRINSYGSNYVQSSFKSELITQSPVVVSSGNYMNLFMGSKKSDKILHIDLAMYMRYSYFFERM